MRSARMIRRCLLAFEQILLFQMKKLVVREREQEFLGTAARLSARETALEVGELLLEISQLILLMLFSRRVLALE